MLTGDQFDLASRRIDNTQRHGSAAVTFYDNTGYIKPLSSSIAATRTWLYDTDTTFGTFHQFPLQNHFGSWWNYYTLYQRNTGVSLEAGLTQQTTNVESTCALCGVDSTTPARFAVVDGCELVMGVAPCLPTNRYLPTLTSLHKDRLFWLIKSQPRTHSYGILLLTKNVL